MAKATVKGFNDIFPNPGAVIAAVLVIAVISIPTCIGVVYARAGGQITSLNDTVTQVDNSVGTPEQSGGWRTVRMRVTAYCPCRKCCGRYSNGETACGHKISPGAVFVAADKEHPFGTEMSVPGYNRAEPVKVLDRGAAIRGNRLDVFFHSHQQALKWGVKYLDVKVRCK